jgi:hypothetical protein
VSSRQIVGLAAVACAACCVGPILGVLGTIAALGLVSSLFIGAAGLIVAAAAVAALIAARRRRATGCSVEVGPVPVELGPRSR